MSCTGIWLLIIASHGSGKMPRSVRADRGQKGVLQWLNDTPVALACGCDLWSRLAKITNGVANVTKDDAGQLTCQYGRVFAGCCCQAGLRRPTCLETKMD